MPATEMFPLLAVYAIAVNLAAFASFVWDKHAARNAIWRIPERNLLTLAFVGGTIGAIAGQRLLRHKTGKQPFRTQLRLVAAFQVIALAALSIPQLRTQILTLIR